MENDSRNDAPSCVSYLYAARKRRVHGARHQISHTDAARYFALCRASTRDIESGAAMLFTYADTHSFIYAIFRRIGIYIFAVAFVFRYYATPEMATRPLSRTLELPHLPAAIRRRRCQPRHIYKIAAEYIGAQVQSPPLYRITHTPAAYFEIALMRIDIKFTLSLSMRSIITHGLPASA